MREKRVQVIVVSLLAMFILVSSIQPFAHAQKTKIVIGAAYALSGPVAPTAAVHHLYYKMIIDDYNAKGGLDVPGIGKLPIEYILYDDEYDPAKSQTLITKLITEDQVDLLFAPWSTAFNVAALPLFEQYKYPVVGLTVGSNTLDDLLISGTYKYFFVTLGQPKDDAEEVEDLFTYINEKIASADQKISKVGFAYRADEHGIEHANALKEGLTAMGMQVPVFESYEPIPPPTDFVPTINKLRDAQVDAVIVCSYDEGATFVHQCITQDYNPKLLMTGPAMETSFLVYGPFGFTPGQVAGIAYYNGFPASNYTTPTMKAWADYHVSYTAKVAGFGYEPFPASAVFYMGLECLFKAVEEHGLDKEKIRDALATETFDTSLGKLTFRVGRSPVVEGQGTLTQWQGKELMDVIWPRNVTTAQIIYPKYPWSWATVKDINRDGKVNIIDVSTAGKAFGSSKGQPRYDFTCDVDGNGTVNILDLAAIAKDFGKHAF